MSTPRKPTEQLALLRSTARRAARTAPPRPAPAAAPHAPVARVVVDVPLAHLDRPFDYLVPADLDEAARPGVRVRVRFAGRLVDGFLLERQDASQHGGRLAFLHAVVSAQPVLTPQVHALAREVADRYAGVLADVLRLAIPPRHARVEREEPGERHERDDERSPADPRPVGRPEPATWARYPSGAALLDAVHAGTPARAVWSALPGGSWPDELARLLATALAAGRGALAVVPDQRDLARVDRALRELIGTDRHVVLTAELGPAERYRRWLAVRRGERRVVLGTRAAAFAPVLGLGLAVVWDDGDDLHAEPRAPYPHVRTVLGLRSRLEGAAFVVGGFARTAEGAALVDSGWAHDVSAPREVVRATAPRVRTAAEGPDDDPLAAAARLPSAAWRAAREALERGPVLVQVPRSGYVPGLACAQCRRSARCPACAGPLGTPSSGHAPTCRWCAVTAATWECPACGGSRLRAQTVGLARTVEELGLAFPRVPVKASGGSAPVLAEVPARPALVLATPGAEPVAAQGYAAALLLDGWALLGRPDLRAGEEALRRWMGAAALVRPASEGGEVVVMADPGHPTVQALLRWDPATYADRELAERAALHLPPAAVLVSLTGEPAAVSELLAAAELPPGVDVLGPVPAGDGGQRTVLRAPRGARRDLAAALRAAAGVRSAHKNAGSVRIQVDPVEVG